ncbi:MAG TPA: hypothetical protein VNR38_13785, partial [Ureibacillus sp.]|nr:hypothetical protein [Ureibacillus sp.]
FYQQTIQALFEDVLFYDEPYTAHLIYYSVKKGKVNLQDPVSKLYDMPLTSEEHAEISRMKEQDVLAMLKIKLYAIKRNATTYAFYFAKNAWEARELHHQIYGQWENRIVDAYNQMIDRGLYFPDTKETKTFRELMKETVVFPRLVCEMEG